MRTLMMNSQCRLKKICMFMGVSLAIVCFVSVYYVRCYVWCSDQAANELIENLCSSYHNQEVAGNMCHKLCDTDSFKYQECGNNRGGKNVILMECDGCDAENKISKIVMKAQYPMHEWTREFKDFEFNHLESLENLIERAKQRVSAQIKFHFGKDISDREDFMSLVWGQDFDAFVRTSKIKNPGLIAVKSIVALGLQQEYGSMVVLTNQYYMPKFFGTCGPAYFVENTPSFVKLGYVLFQAKLPDVLSLNFATWNERAKLALKLIHLMKHFETSFESPLELCDIKSHNLGLNYEKEIALLDSDCVRFDKAVPDPGQNCTTDKECGFLSCEGHCDQNTKRCGGIRTNNNFQTMCKNVFLSHVETLGLLRYPPSFIQKDLHEALDYCAHHTYAQNGVLKKKASVQTLRKIETILLKSIT